MTPDEIRLECLKLAASTEGDVLATASAYAEFIGGVCTSQPLRRADMESSRPEDIGNRS
jgi:hypothetical protein